MEMLLYQPTLSKFNETYVAAPKDGWILDHDTDVGSKCLYDGVSRGVAVRYIGAGLYGCRPGSRTDLLVLGFKDFYWVDTGSRGVEDFLGDVSSEMERGEDCNSNPNSYFSTGRQGRN